MKHLGILGTGSIGASIGLRTRRNGTYVSGYDVRSAAAEQAREIGAIDEIADREKIFEKCDTVVLATPVAATCGELERAREIRATWDLMIDVASVKKPVCDAARGIANFVGTHPLAGSETSGPIGARTDMFEGRAWVVTPCGDAVAEKRAHDFVSSLGAQSLAVSAEEHDAVLALTSHLPQLLAFLLAPRILAGEEDAKRFCGPAGLEILRLGRSNRRLWDEIFAANAEHVAVEGRALAAALVDACDALKSGTFP